MSWVNKIVKLIKSVVKTELANVHTHLPAQVVSYDAATNLCSIQLCINRVRADDPGNLTTVQIPIIEDVPVKQFGSGKCLISVAPQEGSYGVYHVSERDIAKWIDAGGIDGPGTMRMFDLSDGFFDPGVYPTISDGDNGVLQSAVQTDRIEMRTRSGDSIIAVVDDDSIELITTGNITITATGNINASAAKFVLNSEADATALASKVDTLWATLDTLLRTGWTPVAQDGGNALKLAYAAAFPTPPASVASQKSKLDA